MMMMIMIAIELKDLLWLPKSSRVKRRKKAT